MKYEWLLQGLSAPICATWEVTYACNLSCKHCLSASGKRHRNELDTRECKELLDQMAELDVFYVNMGGGEPLMRPDLFELIVYAYDRGLPVQMSTNGLLVDREKAKLFGEIPELRIQVSLDGARELTNDSIRGSGSYQGAAKALRLLSRQGINLSVNFVATSINLAELEEVYQLTRHVGAKFRVARLRPSGSGKESYAQLRLSEDQARELYHWVKDHPDVTTGDSFFILSALGEPIPGLNVCGAARATCCITPTGDVHPCAFLMEEKTLAGNVRQRPLKAIWEDSMLFRLFRKERVGACSGCQVYDDCGGGCHAVSYHLKGDFFAKDPECLLRQTV